LGAGGRRNGVRLTGQTPEWFDRLATLQEGYYYPWRSHLDTGHGEDAYLHEVHRHLRPDADALDVACGHGQVALEIAPHVRSVRGYDRTAPWIDLAQRTAQERGLTNATFVCHDSSPAANGGHAYLPADDASFDLLVCSNGPFHWIEDARRVARPGAVLLMLVPDAVPLTQWHSHLPETLRWKDAADPHWARPAIERRLTAAGLPLHSWWSFDVPEVFPDPEQLYAWLAWGSTPDEVPPFAAVRPTLERVFAEYGAAGGVAIRHRRYLWKATVPGVV
jgi:SAM-dependent methyltransferase